MHQDHYHLIILLRLGHQKTMKVDTMWPELLWSRISFYFFLNSHLISWFFFYRNCNFDALEIYKSCRFVKSKNLKKVQCDFINFMTPLWKKKPSVQFQQAASLITSLIRKSDRSVNSRFLIDQVFELLLEIIEEEGTCAFTKTS